MFKRIEKEVRFYVRKSKTGKSHTYKRLRSYAVFECDDCHEEFKREKGKVDPKRLDNFYVHVCPNWILSVLLNVKELNSVSY